MWLAQNSRRSHKRSSSWPFRADEPGLALAVRLPGADRGAVALRGFEFFNAILRLREGLHGQSVSTSIIFLGLNVEA